MTNENKAQRDRTLILRCIFEKWNPVAMGCKEEQGPKDCALCQVYNNRNDCALCQVYNDRNDCKGCPIAEQTGYPLCKGSPYDDYNNFLGGYKQDIISARDAMAYEIEYLISLLAQEDQDNLEILYKEWVLEGLCTNRIEVGDEYCSHT